MAGACKSGAAWRAPAVLQVHVAARTGCMRARSIISSVSSVCAVASSVDTYARRQSYACMAAAGRFHLASVSGMHACTGSAAESEELVDERPQAVVRWQAS